MSVVDPRGLKIVVARATRVDRDAIDRSRDLILVKLHAEGRSWRQIGAILGLSHEGARKRWRSIPREVREHYGQALV